MRKIIISAGVLLVAGVTAVLCSNLGSGGAMQNSPRPRRQVSVTLFAPASTIEGIAVPPGLERQSIGYLRANEPSDLTLTLPDGRTIHMTVKYVSIAATHATVTDVDLLPLDKSLPYKDAVAEFHRLMDTMKITPDERMRKKMEEWPDDVPAFDPVNRPGFYPHTYEAGTWLSDDFGLSVRVRPADDGGGWFLVLTFAAGGPKRRALWDHSATQPSAGSATRPSPDPTTIR